MDVTYLLRYEKMNTLVVKANTMKEKNSRWYTGGGLFRPVSIVVTSRDLYFNRHPLYITTHDNRFVNVTAEFTNQSRARETDVKVSIYAPSGELVTEQTIKQKRHPQARTQ
jgi:beta-galactosidase